MANSFFVALNYASAPFLFPERHFSSSAARSTPFLFPNKGKISIPAQKKYLLFPNRYFSLSANLLFEMKDIIQTK